MIFVILYAFPVHIDPHISFDSSQFNVGLNPALAPASSSFGSSET